MTKEELQQKITEILKGESPVEELEGLKSQPDFETEFYSLCDKEDQAFYDDFLSDYSSGDEDMPSLEEMEDFFDTEPQITGEMQTIMDRVHGKVFPTKTVKTQPSDIVKISDYMNYHSSSLPYLNDYKDPIPLAGSDKDYVSWRLLHIETINNLYVVEIKYAASLSKINVFTYRKDAVEITSATLKLKIDEEIKEKALEVNQDLKSMAAAIIESPLTSDLEITIAFPDVEKTFLLSIQQLQNIDGLYKTLQRYYDLQNYNNVVHYSLSFWQIMHEKLDREDYPQLKRLCDGAAVILSETLKHYHGKYKKQDELIDILKKCLSKIQVKAPQSKIVKMIENIIEGIATAKNNSCHHKCIRGMFYVETNSSSQTYAYTLPVKVTKQEPNQHFCSNRFENEAVRHQIKESFQAVQKYLRSKGLHKELSIQEFYIDVEYDGLHMLKITERSIGLAAVINYFSVILSQVYDDNENPFSINDRIAASGIVARNGDIAPVSELMAKLEAFYYEIPDGIAYIAADNAALSQIKATDFPQKQYKVVSSLEEMFAYLFFSGDRDRLHQEVTNAIDTLNSKEQPHIEQEQQIDTDLESKANKYLDETVIYVSVPFNVAFKNSFDALIPHLKELNIHSLMYQQDDQYRTWHKQSNLEYTAEKIRQEGWKKGNFTPSILEHFCRIEESRYQPLFKKSRKHIRLEYCLDKVKFAQEGMDKLLISLNGEETAVVTMIFKKSCLTWNKIDEFYRSNTRDTLQEFASGILATIPAIDLLPGNSEPYIFTVIRETKHKENILENCNELIYSLLTGTKRNSISKKAQQWLLGENQTTRDDVFLAVDSQQSVLVEFPGRCENFTCTKIPQKSDNFIQERKIYNDVNYLVWLELLLSIREKTFRMDANQKDLAQLYKLVKGKTVAKHVPYRFWVDTWKETLGIETYYDNLPVEKL